MITETIIALIVPTVACLFAATLYLLGKFRQNFPAILMAWAYLAFGAGMMTLYLAPFGFAASRLFANGLLLVATATICEALLVRVERHIPRRLTALFIAATLAAVGWGLLEDQGLGMRIVAVSIGIGLIVGLLALALWRLDQRTTVDNLILAVAVMVTVVSFSRPVIFYFWAENGYGTEATLFSSSYWVGAVLSGVFSLTACALIMIASIGLEAMETLRQESGTDALTGLLNRRGFEHGVGRLNRQAGRNGLPLSLILCDLDHFKSVNDRHGHACGDRVIEAFAQCLVVSAPEPHIVGRLGGEEFAVVLYGVTGAAARLLAEGLRLDFAARRLAELPGERFTASFGVAEMMPREKLEDFLARADRAMYDAKSAGRDRVRLAPRPSQVVEPTSAARI